MHPATLRHPGPRAPFPAADRHTDRSGVTLIEALISMFMISILAASLIQSVAFARQATHSTSQRVSAFGMARAKFEEVRSTPYPDVASTNFPAEIGIRLSHLAGAQQIELPCDRTVAIQPLASPERKEVTVVVAWRFQQRDLQESFHGVLYPR